MGHVGGDVGEVSVQFLRVEVEQGQGTDAGGVGYPAPDVQRDDLRHDGGMPSLAGRTAHLLNPQAEPRLYGVEQTGLPHAGGPNQGRKFPAQGLPQVVHPRAGDRAGVEHRITDLRVDAEQGLRRLPSHQVYLVGADDGGDVLHLRADQQPVEHAEAGGRLRAGQDENGLVGVGDDDLFPFRQVAVPVPAAGAPSPGRRGQAGQGPLPLVDLLDEPAAVLGQPDAHPVADGHQVGIQPPPLQPPAHPTDEVPVHSVDGEEAALGLDDQAVAEQAAGRSGLTVHHRAMRGGGDG